MECFVRSALGYGSHEYFQGVRDCIWGGIGCASGIWPVGFVVESVEVVEGGEEVGGDEEGDGVEEV